MRRSHAPASPDVASRDARRRARGLPALSSLLLTTLALWTTTPVGAQPAPAAPQARPADADARRDITRAELDAVVRDIELGTTRQAEIRREIDAMERERSRGAQEAVAIGGRIRAAETKLAESEARILGLDRALDDLRGRLNVRRDVLADVLAALQRIGRKPPPALAVRPDDALAAVRSAVLVGALLPELRVEAEKLLADLEAQQKVKTQASAERDRFRAEATDLVAERTRLELLMEDRRKGRSDQEKRLEEERHRAADLAAKAESLRDLLAGLSGQAPLRASVGPAAGTPAAPGPNASTAARLQPAIAFADAKGRLTPPVVGDLVARFGETDAFGVASKGLGFAARPGAQVTSPCDGSVLYAGPFRSYGKLLIINGGGGYHVVLAGMDRIDVELGQFVLAGEPVGVMGARGDAPATTTDGSDRAGRPVLYVEFRKDSASIDPTPWWARTRDEKVRG